MFRVTQRRNAGNGHRITGIVPVLEETILLAKTA